MAGSGLLTVEQKRMEEAAQRAAQRAVNQLRMSRRTLRAGAGQVTRQIFAEGPRSYVLKLVPFRRTLSRSRIGGCSACRVTTELLANRPACDYYRSACLTKPLLTCVAAGGPT